MFLLFFLEDDGLLVFLMNDGLLVLMMNDRLLVLFLDDRLLVFLMNNCFLRRFGMHVLLDKLVGIDFCFVLFVTFFNLVIMFFFRIFHFLSLMFNGRIFCFKRLFFLHIYAFFKLPGFTSILLSLNKVLFRLKRLFWRIFHMAQIN